MRIDLGRSLFESVKLRDVQSMSEIVISLNRNLQCLYVKDHPYDHVFDPLATSIDQLPTLTDISMKPKEFSSLQKTASSPHPEF
ncbi:hypothetical protein ACJ72_08785 [Emergomyces africanus]|uniref:Uncharacterized protein n=1 Tax=Emergomyces africanus TaxID=1955775 RepID=A0A1B7NJN1_9EURO|nr:hypothetical protein ACJ72_08785 [Emergomyces africanus]